MKRTLLTCVVILGLTIYGNGAIAKDCIQTELGGAELRRICEGLSKAAVTPEQIAYLASCSSGQQASCKEGSGKPLPEYHDHNPYALNNLPNPWSMMGSAFQ